MRFENLKDKCEYYRSLSDTKLIPNMPVIIMLDGHCFSKLIKTRYKLPFDDTFIKLMDATAAHLCSHIQGAQFAYTQSDEISIFIKDYITPETESYFGFRTCKLLSLIAAEASAFFNRKLFEMLLTDSETIIEAKEKLKDLPLITFDCKVWNVPTENDVFAWFLYRQNDCVRNSKQQFAQTYLPHQQLMGKNTDEQINLTKELTENDWNLIDEGQKYGRIIYPELVHHVKTVNGNILEFDRHEYISHFAHNLNWNPEFLRNLIKT